MSPNEQNSVIFQTEIVLKGVFLDKCFTWKEIIMYLRHITTHYCHINTNIGLVVMDVF